LGLSGRHSFKRKLFAGVWLTACTYPIVVIVLPTLFEELGYSPDGPQRWMYLVVAETFAPVAECLLFFLAFWVVKDGTAPGTIPGVAPGQGSQTFSPSEPETPVLASSSDRMDLLRDMIAITLANLASFGLGEVMTF